MTKVYFILILTLFAVITATSQTVTTWTGKQIPVTVESGADVTIAPIEPKFDHVGWVQIKYTVYPVYKGERGGLFTYRKGTKADANGVVPMNKYYLTDAQKAKMISGK